MTCMKFLSTSMVKCICQFAFCYTAVHSYEVLVFQKNLLIQDTRSWFLVQTFSAYREATEQLFIGIEYKSQTFIEHSQMDILNISIQMNSENFNSRVTVWHESFIRHQIQLKLILDYTVLKNVYSF